MTASKPSAADRLTAVKRGIKQIESERDQLMSQWRQALVADDTSAVERCERQLDELEWKLRRCQALIDLLPPLVAQEEQQQQGWTWPTTLADATAQLLAVEPWIVKMQAVPRVDRSARFDAELDSLVNRQYRLIKLVESFQPRSMVAS